MFSGGVGVCYVYVPIAVLVAGFGCPAAAARFAAAWASCAAARWPCGGSGAAAAAVWGVSVPVCAPPGSPSLGAPLPAALPAPVWVARG